jgi:ATP-dependent helicase HrpB
MLCGKIMEGAWPWQSADPQAHQLVLRIKCAAAAWPEMGFPAMDDGDWRCIYHEVCEGKTSLSQLSTRDLVKHIRSYIGPHRASFIDRAAPAARRLPSGRTAKILYSDNGPPELSARIGDLVGHPARFTVLDGRVEGVFDIKAPNFRTVQKTRDLEGFWKTVYPGLKKQLQRRYPRHPWP